MHHDADLELCEHFSPPRVIGRVPLLGRRDLAASLALARPGSPARVPILAQITAIDAELAGRSGARPDDLPGSSLP